MTQERLGHILRGVSSALDEDERGFGSVATENTFEIPKCF
ncbi:uncharacterized protein G2W53_019424 [Senna tora]|uniref:Uncharacterized protein n=1 Tax=Senna tora TaxID=362788 RepID=A0A834WLZ3_9FABA|nr:uncharacterized protein G2W53_019424 [Senna tora]